MIPLNLAFEQNIQLEAIAESGTEWIWSLDGR